MSRLFVDTFYLVALLHRRDAWHDRAVAFSHTLTSDDALLTTDAILVEFLAAFSNKGQHLRQEAAITAHHLPDRPNVIVIPQDRILFLRYSMCSPHWSCTAATGASQPGDHS